MSIGSFGVTDTSTYGQTFVAPPTVSVMNGFIVHTAISGGSPGTVRGYLYAWDSVNGHATGTALWVSATRPMPAGSHFSTLAFSLPNVAVTPGDTYVFFVSTSETDRSASWSSSWGSVNDTAYAQGTFVYVNNSSDVSQWTLPTWTTNYGSDLAFTAEFDGDVVVAPTALLEVPVPALDAGALGLLGALLLAAGIPALRRRQHAARRTSRR